MLTRSPSSFINPGPTYLNEPRLSQREKSPIHYGAFKLDVMGELNEPERLQGHYWTDRDTKGEMEMTHRVTTVYESFDTARNNF